MGFFNDLLKIGGTILSGIGVFTANPLLIGLGAGASALGGVFDTNEKQAQANKFQGSFNNVLEGLVAESLLPVEEQPGFKAALGRQTEKFGDVAATARRTLGSRFAFGSGIETATQQSIEKDRIRAESDLFGQFDIARRRSQEASLNALLTAQSGAQAQANLSGEATGDTLGNLLNLLLQSRSSTAPTQEVPSPANDPFEAENTGSTRSLADARTISTRDIQPATGIPGVDEFGLPETPPAALALPKDTLVSSLLSLEEIKKDRERGKIPIELGPPGSSPSFGPGPGFGPGPETLSA